MLSAFAGVMSLFLLGLVGYVLARCRWFSAESKALVARLVTLVSLPPYLFTNVAGTFSRDEFLGLLSGSFLPVLSIGLSFIMGLALVRLLSVRPGRRGFFATAFASSNTIFIGLPVNIAIFGPEALPFVLMYFLANSAFIWTLGNYSISRDGSRNREPLWSAKTVKRLISPPLIGFALGLASAASGWSPPSFLMDALHYVGSMTTPLALIYTGLSLADVRLGCRSFADRDMCLLISGRLLAAPLLMLLLTRLIPLPPLMAQVFIIQSALPIATNIAILAGFHGADVAYASEATAWSTLLCLLTIPLYIALIT